MDEAVPQPGSSVKRKRTDLVVVPQLVAEGSVGAHGQAPAPSASKGGRPSSGSGSLPPDEDMGDNRLTLEFLEENGYFDMPIQVKRSSAVDRQSCQHSHVPCQGTCTLQHQHLTGAPLSHFVLAQQAAAELRVGVTTLKKVCRVNSIGRWPFRKRSSLNRLIDKTREYFANEPEQCAEALAQLESQRAMLKVSALAEECQADAV